MREPVVEQEEVGSGPQPGEGLHAGPMAVGADHHRDSRQLAGELHRLVAGLRGPQQRPVAAAHHPHAAATAAIAARQDADRHAPLPQVAGHGGDQWRLAAAPPVQVADADHRQRQPAGALAVPALAQAMGSGIQPLPGRAGGRRCGQRSRAASGGAVHQPPPARASRSGREPGAMPARMGASISRVRASAPRFSTTSAAARSP